MLRQIKDVEFGGNGGGACAEIEINCKRWQCDPMNLA
jgi:hypothetical protein